MSPASTVCLRRRQIRARRRRPAAAGPACRAGRDAQAVLGFDALRSAMTTPADELSLLRMALDAFANAVRARDPGAGPCAAGDKPAAGPAHGDGRCAASGIAHNFNNIVGAILGYTEMAEVQVATGSRPARNLTEIRRAGERARDLVDQILAFGRRRDIRRKPVSVKALIAETQPRCCMPRCPRGSTWSSANRRNQPSSPAQPGADPAGDSQSLQQRGAGDGWQGAYRGRGARCDIAAEHGRSATETWPRAAMCGFRLAMPGAAWTRPCSSGSSNPSSPRASAEWSGAGDGARDRARAWRRNERLQRARQRGSRFEVWLPCSAATERSAERGRAGAPARARRNGAGDLR